MDRDSLVCERKTLELVYILKSEPSLVDDYNGNIVTPTGGKEMILNLPCEWHTQLLHPAAIRSACSSREYR